MLLLKLFSFLLRTFHSILRNTSVQWTGITRLLCAQLHAALPSPSYNQLKHRESPGPDSADVISLAHHPPTPNHKYHPIILFLPLLMHPKYLFHFVYYIHINSLQVYKGCPMLNRLAFLPDLNKCSSLIPSSIWQLPFHPVVIQVLTHFF